MTIPTYPCLCPHCGSAYRQSVHPRYRQDGERPGPHRDGRLVLCCADCAIARDRAGLARLAERAASSP